VFIFVLLGKTSVDKPLLEYKSVGLSILKKCKCKYLKPKTQYGIITINVLRNLKYPSQFNVTAWFTAILIFTILFKILRFN